MLHDRAIDAFERRDDRGYREAISLEQQAVSKFPRLVEAHLQMATAFWELQEFDGCLGVLDRMRAATQEEVPDFHFFRANALKDLDRLDEAIVEAQKEVAVIGPDQEVLALLATLYQTKFVAVQEAGLTNDIPRIGECWLVSLWRFIQFQDDEEVEKIIANICRILPRERFAPLGIPRLFCGLCRFPTKLSGNVPIVVTMGLHDGIYAFVCEKCVRRRGIPIDETFPHQHRIWIEGEQLLQYGNIFVSA